MNSLILRTAVRLLVVLLLVFSVFIFFRGHDEPGGGFIGGLIAAGAFALYSVAFGPKKTREMLRVSPRALLGFGLAAGVASGLLALFSGQAFLTGQWGEFSFGNLDMKIGSPLLFDIGVYSVVVGFVLAFVLSLDELEGADVHVDAGTPPSGAAGPTGASGVEGPTDAPTSGTV
jgi:multicomponent Na+:H+ antiporter subunit B